MKEKVTLNVKEQKRLLVLNEILAGRMTGQEGAVRIAGSRAGQQVAGHGYVEMTGYAASMQGQF